LRLHRIETDGYVDNPTQKGWLTAILELGAWFGAVMSGFVAEAMSRKYGILIATAVFIIGVVVQITAIAGGHEEILAGRFITLVNHCPASFNIC
jgi:MFS family permease